MSYRAQRLDPDVERRFQIARVAGSEHDAYTALESGQQCGGHSIGSITGLRGSAGSATYSATKAAINSFTQSWADEYGSSGVRVNAVAPGPIATERQVEFANHVAPMLARIPSRRMSTPAEVAAAVVFLASDDAANIHGTLLGVGRGLGGRVTHGLDFVA